MFYRVEARSFPEYSSTGGNWCGIFGFWDSRKLTVEQDKAFEDYYKALPEPDLKSDCQFWFTEKGYLEFEKVTDIILTALPDTVCDIQVLVKDNFNGEKVLYEDEFQIAIAI